MVTVTASALDNNSPDDGEVISETPKSFGFKCVMSSVTPSLAAFSSSVNVV